MIKRMRYHSVRLAATGLMACVLCACGRPDRRQLDILPDTDKARAALDTALTAWKKGEKMSAVKGDSVGIQVSDRMWMKGSKLAAFEILQAEDKPGPRWFSVKLTLAGAQPQTVRYAVLGIDPLWVYREEDYKQACDMANQ